MNNSLKNRICYYSTMYEGRSVMREITDFSAKMGVGGVEFMNFCDELETPDMTAARELGARAKSLGLKLPCFSAYARIAEDDREEQCKIMFRYAEICSELEIPYFHHTIYPHLDPLQIAGKEEEIFLRGVESVRRINEYAARLGVKTVIEDQGFIFNGVKNFTRLVRECDGKIGTVLDLGNIWFVDEAPEDFARELIDSIVHVHIKDYTYIENPTENDYTSISGKRFHGCEIGEGIVNLERVAKVLKDANYNGFYSLELDGISNPASAERAMKTVIDFFG